MKRMSSSTRTRISLLVIASSLAIVTGALSLSAYLTGKSETIYETLRVEAKDELELNLYSPEYTLPDRLMPGDEILFKPTISRGIIPCYVFVDYQCAGDKVDAAINNCWKKLSDESTIYYYSQGGVIAPFPENEVVFFNSITIPTSATGGEISDIAITAYAVQADHNDGEEPTDIAVRAGAIPEGGD